MHRIRFAAIWVAAAVIAPAAAWSQDGSKAYRALGLRPQDVLTGTVVRAGVVPGGSEQTVCLATYLTGEEGEADAVNIRLGVFDNSGDELVPVYTRDFGADRGGWVANGDLLVFDVDRDGVKEMIVSYDDFEQPLVDQRVGEVILHDGKTLTTAWTGLLEYDATRAARDVPQERRDRYVREFDWTNTLRTRGATLFVNKKVIAVAGERLPEPRIVAETFELRGKPDHW
ncbi:MAG TPA: hypothetical protein VD788_06470 [Candidatus Polarisedimenticolaceae bacterium]|nr:hypothetical protein [Candidatus Polarisedimenticolaceae bacterium]